MSNPISQKRKKNRDRGAIITLTTDFGTKGYFSGSLKGQLLSRVPDARIIDLTHEIPRHDVISGAFIIKEAYPNFPIKTIHVIVVDPGVGTDRKKLIVKRDGHLFIAPDNGVLTYLFEGKAGHVFEVGESEALPLKKSPTFAGRDHFVPIAAFLANGGPPEDLGREIRDYQCLSDLFSKRKGNDLTGKIIYFDLFGNAITNISEDHIGNSAEFELRLKGHTLSGLKKNYAEGTHGRGNMIMNSSGQLEIFVPLADAKASLGLNLMDDILIPNFYND